MKAVIKEYYSIDIPDLFTYQPSDPAYFGFNLQFILGPDEESKRDFEEIFNLFVCTPNYVSTYIELSYPTLDVVFSRPLIFVREYNFKVLLNAISKHISAAEGKTWEEVAMQISLIAQWEFENYKPQKTTFWRLVVFD